MMVLVLLDARPRKVDKDRTSHLFGRYAWASVKRVKPGYSIRGGYFTPFIDCTQVLETKLLGNRVGLFFQ